MRKLVVAAALLGACGTSVAERVPEAVDAAIDVLVDVPDAHAGEDAGVAEGWTRVEAACAQHAVDGAPPLYFADVAMPGRSKEDLSRSVVMVCAGFEYCFAASVQVKNEAIRHVCQKASDQVVFMIPPRL
jgi:hypothetical protein